jgi:hypothetical protein
MNAVVEVAPRRFRDRQKEKGDTYFSPEEIARIKKSLQQADEGNVTICDTIEDSIKHLEAL